MNPSEPTKNSRAGSGQSCEESLKPLGGSTMPSSRWQDRRFWNDLISLLLLVVGVAIAVYTAQVGIAILGWSVGLVISLVFGSRDKYCFWGVIYGLPLLFLLAAGSVLVMPIALLAHQIRERRFTKRMQSVGRYIDWQQVADSQDGTLIVEQAHKDGVRFWWTPNDLLQLSPHQPPAENEYMRLSSPHPFHRWCWKHYTSATTGSAMLTVPNFRPEPGFVTREFMAEKTNGVNVVIIVKEWGWQSRKSLPQDEQPS